MSNFKSRLVGAIFACILFPTSAAAQFQIGGHVGFDFSASDLYIGPHAVFNLPVPVGSDDYLKLNPEFSYHLSDSNVPGVSYSFWLLGATALYPLGFEFASSYFGVGVILARASTSIDVDPLFEDLLDEVGDSSTRLGLNLKVGAEFGESNVRPFGDVGYVITSEDWLYVQGGVRLGFGSE